MASDLNKNLDRARRSLEKNKLREAVSAYQAVLDELPSHQEALQALADIYTRLNEPAQAARYYAAQFDRLLDTGDTAKATAIFTRFLRPFPQPPDRLLRFATLLQRQNRTTEAIEQFTAASQMFLDQRRDIEALACYESIALLDPENPSRHAVLGELAEKLRHSDLAARSFLRAGQLLLASGNLDEALEYFGRAHGLQPAERTGALLFAEAKLRKGDNDGAVALLDPLSPNEKDATFLALFGEALLRAGHLDRAQVALLAYYRQRPESFSKLFELMGAFIRAEEDAKAIALLQESKEMMRQARRDGELSAHIDRLAASHPDSVTLAEMIARLYEEMNRESKYFDALMRLFDLYLAADRIKEAGEALDRLVDIDPYDYRNQERIGKLEGKADPAFLKNIQARAAKAATVSTRSEGFSGAGSEAAAGGVPLSDEMRAQQALEDLIVQVEIFLQYALQNKATERLERIAELFPGEEDRNERLRALYERANWWPRGVPSRPIPPPAPPPAPPAVPASASPAPPPPVDTAGETHRDLAAIAEINRLMYRQPTPREILATTAQSIAKHLNVARCFVLVGGANEGVQTSAQFSATGMPGIAPARIPAVMAIAAKAAADSLGGIELQAAGMPELRELGLESALAVVLSDKESQESAGAIFVGDTTTRAWKPSESFFLQAVGDQLLLSVNHARLRSLVRSLAVADEKTGLLNRGAYIDCLLAETNRSKSHSTPLSLIVLHVDGASELLRQHGDAAVEQYVNQVARTLSSAIRQTDIAVKYTSWSLVFILPDTSLENAQVLAEKLRQAAVAVEPPWGAGEMALTAVVAQATAGPGDEPEDRVTEWINRAETGLEDVLHRGGNSLVALATPQKEKRTESN